MSGDKETSKSLLTTGDTNNIEKPHSQNAAEGDAGASRNIDNYIRLRVVNILIPIEVVFLVNPESVLDTLKRSYCHKLGFPENKLWFMFLDHRIADGETPKRLGMVSGDVISIYQHCDSNIL